MKTTIKGVALAAILSYGAALWAQVPQIITYQGRLSASGTNFNGSGHFKFAVVNGGTNLARQATTTATVSYGFIVAVNLVSGGAGYPTAPVVTITDATGSNAVVTANVSGGAVTGFNIISNGRDYSASPTVTIAPPPANMAYVTYWSNDGTSVDGSEPTSAVSVPVNQGLFTVPLGETSCANMSSIPWNVFTNAPLYLRIWFNDGTQGFHQLAPDQQIGAVGYAMVAERALHVEVDTASLANGAVTASKLADGGVTQTKLGAAGGAAGRVLGTDGTNLIWQALPDIFTIVLASGGSGSGLDADLLDGLDSTAFSLAGHSHADYAPAAHLHAADQIASGVLDDARLAGNIARTNQVWLLGGNTGTTAGADFLGTRDNQPVEIKVNGQRALRLEPNSSGAPNVIGGAHMNAVGPGTVGATIAGGGATNYLGSYVVSNTVLADFGTIGGGAQNSIKAYAGYATIAGGTGNKVEYNVNYGTIGGGGGHVVSSTAATVAGGSGNGILTNSPFSSIGGGAGNVISNWAPCGTIAGGYYNLISSNVGYATIPGGNAAKASHYGEMAYASGSFANAGDAQSSLHVLRQTTTTANATEMYLDQTNALLTVPVGSTWAFDILVTARSSGGDSAGYRMQGVIENVGGSTRMISPPTITVLGEDVAAWDATVRDDDTQDALSIRVYGAVGTTIRWVAQVRTAQVSW